MFEVKKDSRNVNSRVEYPLTTAHAHQFVYINGFSHYLFGDSEVKCDEGDKFESAFGKELAETNATINMLKEYKRVLIKFTKRPEWRKEKQATKEDFNECFKKAMIEMQTAVENFNKRFGIKE
jgi:hypothetical protein